MSLLEATLKSEIQSVLDLPPTDMLDFADKLSTAYKTYCVDALDISGDALSTFGTSSMKTILESLDASNNTLNLYAQTIEDSIISFWNNSTMATANPPPGMLSESSVDITAMTSNSIKPSLLSLLESGSATTTSQSAQDHASVIHTATLTVMTTHTGPSSVIPNPIIVIGPSSIT